jgi:WD40 repeat protein
VWAVACAGLPDGRVVAVTGGGDGSVRVWDLTTGTPVGEPLTGHTDEVRAVACTSLPDGRMVAVTTGRDETVRVWDLTTGTPVTDALPFLGSARGLALTDDQRGVRIVVTGSGGLATLELSFDPS